MRPIKHSLFLLFFLVLSAEIIQQHSPFIFAEPLQGSIKKMVKPTLYMDNWLSGNYQDSLMKFNEQDIGLHTFLIRLHNQIAYSIFGEINVNDVEAGKDQTLFETKYIKTYLGEDFAGENVIKENVKKLVYIKRELKKRNIDLLLVLVPGKPSLLAESLPTKYTFSKHYRTNYDAYTEHLQKEKFDYIDFKNYFLKLNPRTPHALFTRLGTHWSLYAGTVAADSLFSCMEHVHHIDMLNYTKNGGDETTKPRDSDADMEEPMNLLFHIPSYPMYYPNISFETDPSKSKPDVLIIGDSFIWNWINYYPFFSTMFDTRSSFWYYNTEVWWPLTPGQPKKKISEFNFDDETLKRDFIIIESTENNLYNLGNNFITNLYRSLKEKELHPLDTKVN